MSQIEFTIATEVLEKLDVPHLLLEEEQMAAAAPQLSEVEVLDRALACAIAKLHYTVNQQTFEYLRWKVVVARETARRLVEASQRRRADRFEAQERLSHTFYASDGATWSVTEIPGNVPGRPGRRCLIFASVAAVRRVWDYPDNWRTLSDHELEELSWTR